MMTAGEITDVMYELFVLAVRLAGPVLVISMLVGIVIAILQAATQIHEQTLTFVPKLLVIGIILIISGDSMLKTLQEFFIDILDKVAG